MRYMAMLRVPLKRSYYLALLLALAHVGSAAILIPLDLTFEAKLVIAVLVTASFAYSLLRHALLLSPHSIVSIEFKDRENAAAQFASGAWRTASILGTTYVSPLLTVLNLRIAGCMLPRHAVIVPDSIAREDFRQLRVILRWSYARAKAEP